MLLLKEMVYNSHANYIFGNTSLDFEDVEVNTENDLILVVSNTGSADLVINDFTFNGTDASEFSIQNVITPLTIVAEPMHL